MSTGLFAAHGIDMPLPPTWNETSLGVPERTRVAGAILDSACLSGLFWLVIFAILR